jgi:hypothetical protein
MPLASLFHEMGDFGMHAKELFKDRYQVFRHGTVCVIRDIVVKLRVAEIHFTLVLQKSA